MAGERTSSRSAQTAIALSAKSRPMRAPSRVRRASSNSPWARPTAADGRAALVGDGEGDMPGGPSPAARPHRPRGRDSARLASGTSGARAWRRTGRAPRPWCPCWPCGRRHPRPSRRLRPRCATRCRQPCARLVRVRRPPRRCEGSASPRKPSVAMSQQVLAGAAWRWRGARPPAPARRRSCRSRRR